MGPRGANATGPVRHRRVAIALPPPGRSWSHTAISSPETVSSVFHWPLRINAFGVLFLMIAFITLRSRLAALRLQGELAPPLPEPTGAIR